MIFTLYWVEVVMRNPFKKHFQAKPRYNPLEGAKLDFDFAIYEISQIKEGLDLRGKVNATDIITMHIRQQEYLHMGITGRITRKRITQKIEEGRISWFEGYLYYSWKNVKVARRQMPKKPPVLRDWMFFNSSDPKKRMFNKDRDIELLVPLEDLIKKGVVIG
jgi:hypothetical protein